MQPHNLTIEGPKKARHCVILAHGAGESSQSSFLSHFAEELVKLRYRVARFDFPYMLERSTTGRKRPPDREAVLRETWLDVLKRVPQEHVVIGGKSMGGRIASLVFEESRAAGLLCLGYPFHPTGRPEKLRIDHLPSITRPGLIVQGERDPFGDREEVASYPMPETIQVHWVPEGDHSFQPPRRNTDRSYEQNLKNASRAIERFLFEVWPER